MLLHFLLFATFNRFNVSFFDMKNGTNATDRYSHENGSYPLYNEDSDYPNITSFYKFPRKYYVLLYLFFTK